MQKQTFNVLFLIRRAGNKASIYARVTVKGKSKEISLNRKIKPKNWSVKYNKVKGNSQDADEINEYLDKIKLALRGIQSDLIDGGEEVTAEAIVMKYKGEGNTPTLLELLELHNEEIRLLIGKGYSRSTYGKFITSRNHIAEYSLKNYNKKDVSLSYVDYNFIKQFEVYLKTQIGCKHNSAMKHVKSLRKITNRAIACGYIAKDPFFGYKITTERVERERLNSMEVDRIENVALGQPHLEVTRDLFLFQCYTGFSYDDIKKMQLTDLEIELNGSKWIWRKRSKSKTRYNTPLLEFPAAILSKYKDHYCRQNGYLLPVPSVRRQRYLNFLGLVRLETFALS
jgi:integrase